MEQKFKLDELEELSCHCGNKRFESKITMRRISPIQSGKPEPIIQPFGLIVCAKCGDIFESPKIIV